MDCKKKKGKYPCIRIKEDLQNHSCLAVAKFCLTLCDPMDTPGSSVLHYLPEFAKIHAHWVSDAI